MYKTANAAMPYPLSQKRIVMVAEASASQTQPLLRGGESGD